MRFSALDFSHLSSEAFRAASRVGSGDLAAVPFIGRASTMPPCVPLKKRSGEEQHTYGQTMYGQLLCTLSSA